MMPPPRTTCADYRQEMLLLSLRRQLAGGTLSDQERASVVDRIRDLERATGLDEPAE